MIDLVAPHWGAWIEIRSRAKRIPPMLSHPTGVRGLKSKRVSAYAGDAESHPTGVRGLKSIVRDGYAVEVGRTPLGCVD